MGGGTAMLKHASEHDAQAYAPSMMLKLVLSNALRTHARTYVRTTHLERETYVSNARRGVGRFLPNGVDG